MKCPKCNCEMEDGALVVGRSVFWMPAFYPLKSAFSFAFNKAPKEIKMIKKNQFWRDSSCKIKSYRCDSCHLEIIDEDDCEYKDHSIYL